MKTGYRIRKPAYTAGIRMGSLWIRALFFGVLLFLPLSGKEKDMKITYEFCNGERDTVEVDEELGEFLMESRRLEENLERKERYHCCPLFDDNDKEIELADWRQPIDAIEENELRDELREMLKMLTETQRKRLLLFAGGMSLREIARQEGCDHKAVLKSITQVHARLKNHLDI